MLFKFVVPSLAMLSIAANAQTPPATAAAPAPTVTVIEEIAAKVNGEIVTRGELEEKYKEIEGAAKQSSMKGQQLADAIAQAKSEVLRDEIDQLLLVQKAKDLPGLNVEPEVTKYFDKMQAQYKFNDA